MQQPPAQEGHEVGRNQTPWVSRTRLVGFAAGPLAASVIWLIPFSSLSTDAHRLAIIMAWVVVYWIAEPIPLPVTALLGSALCVLAGIASVKVVLSSYAHPVIFLFIGSFFLAQAMAVHGVDRRFASWMLALPWVEGRPLRVLLALGLITAMISMWISNTAATAIMLPVALGVLATMRSISASHLGSYPVGVMLLLSYAATAGGVVTIVGTPPNLIGVALIAQETGVTLSFLTWMGFGLPLGLLMLAVAWGLLCWIFPCQSWTLTGMEGHLAEQHRRIGPWTRGQVNACVAFTVAVVLWIVPGVMGAMLGAAHPVMQWLDRHLPNELVAILAAGLLFFLPTNLKEGTFTLSWKQASDISWGTILLFGGGLAFSDLMVKTGLSDAMGRSVVDLFAVQDVWSLTAVAICVAILLSEAASNTAAASMVIPVVIAIANSAGVSAVPPAIGACLGASFGFALPVSTPPNAIVYGTGLVPMSSMIRVGLLFDLLGAGMIWLVLRLLCPVLGLG